jgi:aspartyl-tRNA(Asn)/glutamyl-tRNA(Gln) amidotransferase subunit A
VTADLIYSDASELAELLRNRKVSSVEVVQAHLDRIQAVNPKVNANRHTRRRCSGGREGCG